MHVIAKVDIMNSPPHHHAVCVLYEPAAAEVACLELRTCHHLDTLLPHLPVTLPGTAPAVNTSNMCV